MERKGIRMNKKSTHPFAPEIPEGATKLIIGTMPPYRFCNTDEMLYDDDVNFYYGSRDNYFWELVSDASGKRLTYANTQEAINERKKLLADLHMGMVDMIVSCVHKDGKADDESLCDIEERDNLKAILHEHSKIDTLIYTNKSANILKWVNKSSDKQYHEGWDKSKTHASVVIDKKAYKVIRLYSPSPYALRSVSKEVRREQYDMVFKLE